MADDAALTRFANSEIHQNVAETNAVVNLRFVVGKRVGVASSGPDRRRGPAEARAANAAAIARVVEELEDWGGLPGADRRPGRGWRRSRRRPPRPAPGAAGGRRSAPSSPRPMPPGSRPSARSPPGRRRRRSPTRTASGPARDAHDVRSCSPCRWGRTAARATPSRPRSTATAIDAAAIGREAADEGARDRERGRHRGRRLPGRARGVRGRRPAATCSATSGSQRPRRPGGAQLRRARQADRLGARDDRRRRLRPGRPARWRSTTRASPSSG